MAKTSEMRLIELMVLKEDIGSVLEFIGKQGTFQFLGKAHEDTKLSGSEEDEALILMDTDCQYYEELLKASVFFEIETGSINVADFSVPTAEDRTKANKFLVSYKQLEERLKEAHQKLEKVTDAYKEAKAFSNLKVSYSELEHLSFLTLKIGKIAPENFEMLKDSLMDNAVVIPLGEDNSRVIVASSKKGRFALDAELKNHNFVELEVPSDFKGVPESALKGLEEKKAEADKALEDLITEKANFAETHKTAIHNLIKSFAIGVQISDIVKGLESTELVYRITGWVPLAETETYMKELDNITSGRIAFREYSPFEVPSVVAGKEQVPVP